MRSKVSAITMAAVLLGAGAALAGQEAPAVPSGIVLQLQEILVEEGEGGLARFRYVAVDLDSFGFAGVEEDFPVLCADVVLPWAADHAPVARVVISMASAPLEFGTNAPDITQFFEVFRLEQAACIWEGF